MEPIEQWAIALKLNPDSSVTRQLYEHRSLTVLDYISQFRKGKNVRMIPYRALTMTVEELLHEVKTNRGRFEGVNVRKILIDVRDKFER